MGERFLEGKSALVTGGSRGIGAAVALGLAARGAHVLISYRESKAKAASVVEAIEEHGVRGMATQSDQADPGAAPMLIATAVKAFGGLDILVNNAGTAHTQRLGDNDDWTDADAMWMVNTHGVIATIRAAAGVLAEDGRIITIGSVSGSRAGLPGGADYCGSKAALAGYTRGAAMDLAPRRITVNVVESGMMTTDMALGLPEAAKTKINSAIPLGRFGQLDEIAGAVAFLTSPSASYVTGTTFTIDGGLSA